MQLVDIYQDIIWENVDQICTIQFADESIGINYKIHD